MYLSILYNKSSKLLTLILNTITLSPFSRLFHTVCILSLFTLSCCDTRPPYELRYVRLAAPLSESPGTTCISKDFCTHAFSYTTLFDLSLKFMTIQLKFYLFNELFCEIHDPLPVVSLTTYMF